MKWIRYIKRLLVGNNLITTPTNDHVEAMIFWQQRTYRDSWQVFNKASEEWMPVKEFTDNPGTVLADASCDGRVLWHDFGDVIVAIVPSSPICLIFRKE